MARILLLGGLDPTGGAGLTVDAAVVSLLGGEPLPIALATTVQGLRGFVRSVPIDAAVIREQVGVVLADGPVSAVKIGYVGSAEQVVAVAEMLQSLRDVAKIIVDPVLSATAGGMSSGDDLVVAYREHLVPCAHLVTPNTLELGALTDGCAHSLLELGAQAVLHKGGHGEGPDAIDELWTNELLADGPPVRFHRSRFDCGPVRGTGCALASAIATHLASDRSLVDACRAAGDWLSVLLSRVKPRSDGLPVRVPLSNP
jgi:hydroxymethylpyrimidine/phosphomethylpyrimidine kinase